MPTGHRGSHRALVALNPGVTQTCAVLPLGSQEVDLRTRVRVQQFIWEVIPIQEHSGEHRQQGTESRGTY